MKFVLIVIGLAIAATIATYARYQSLNPCDWMERDLVRQTELPSLVVRARIHAAFLIDGITDPGPYDCIMAWWEFRAEGLPGDS